jgi:regulator of replication initiation timing
MDDLMKAVRHHTLEAIANGETLLKGLAGKKDKVSEALEENTERLVEHLKEELERWETKYKKAKAKEEKKAKEAEEEEAS